MRGKSQTALSVRSASGSRPRRARRFGLITLLVAATFLIAAASASARQLDVVFDAGTTAQQQAATLASYGGAVGTNADLETATIDVDQTDVDAARAALLATDLVSSVSPAQHFAASGTPDDPLYSQEWWMSRLGVPSAWSVSQGSGITVAVVDEGMDLQHEDLQGQFVPGYDFVDNDSDPSAAVGEQHATHVAGIIGAVANNGLGIAGIAPGVKIMPVRVLTESGGTDSAISDGITWAVDHGANVINLSLGGPGESPELASAISYAVSHGDIVTCASGNDGDSGDGPDYPGADPACLTVGATDESNQLASFSETGSQVDLVAPGVDITSTVPDVGNGDYETWEGTSMSTPMVSAAAALLMAHGETAAQAVSALTSTATDLGTPGYDDDYGWGLLNIAGALGAPITAPPVPVCQGAVLSVAQGADVSFTPSCTDPADGTPQLAYSIVGQGALGSATVGATGTIDYRSTAAVGTDTFTYVAHDAELDASTATTVTVTVTPPPTVSVPAKQPSGSTTPFLSLKPTLVLSVSCGTTAKKACLIWKKAARLVYKGRLTETTKVVRVTVRGYHLAKGKWKLAARIPVSTTVSGTFTVGLTKRQLAQGEWRLQAVTTGGAASAVRYAFSL